jgi:hypothetical protein
MKLQENKINIQTFYNLYNKLNNNDILTVEEMWQCLEFKNLKKKLSFRKDLPEDIILKILKTSKPNIRKIIAKNISLPLSIDVDNIFFMDRAKSVLKEYAKRDDLDEVTLIGLSSFSFTAKIIAKKDNLSGKIIETLVRDYSSDDELIDILFSKKYLQKQIIDIVIEELETKYFYDDCYNIIKKAISLKLLSKDHIV